MIHPYNGERLCPLWGTSLRLRNKWRCKHILTFTRQVLETRYPPVYDRRKRKTSYCLRESTKIRHIDVNDKSTTLTRQVEETAGNINIINRPKQNKKVVTAFGMNLKYTKIMATMTDRTRQTCSALRTFPNLLVLRMSHCASRFPMFNRFYF